MERLDALEARLRALETQQTLVFADASGKPEVVMGWLKPITGINAFGIASFKTGVWVQL